MDLKALLSQFAVSYGKLARAQKRALAIAVGGMAALVVATLFLLFRFGVHDQADYSVLFDHLSTHDAARVMEQLETDGVPYRVPREDLIEVPHSEVYKERIRIASMGILREGSVGFERFGETETIDKTFEQERKYRRALEGELARSIDSLAPVERSTVSLALPPRSLFGSVDMAPSASVMVRLHPDRFLSAAQIRGIKRLVASSTPNLRADNVTLINSTGEMIGEDETAVKMGELSSLQQQYKTQEEKKLEEKIVNLLAPFLGGKERVVARVSIEYDFSEQSFISEVFEPERVVRTEETFREKKALSLPFDEIVDGNVDVDQNAKAATYEISKTVSTQKGEFARIKRMTAAVAVDGKYEPRSVEGNISKEGGYAPLDEAELQAIDALVKHSIGIDEARGDRVSIHNFEFKPEKAYSEPGAKEPTGTFTGIEKTLFALKPFAKYLLAALFLYLFYRLIVLPFVDRVLGLHRKEEEKPKKDVESAQEEALAEQVRRVRRKIESQLQLGEQVSEEKIRYDLLLEKVRSHTRSHPDEIAALIEALLEKELPAASFSLSKSGFEGMGMAEKAAVLLVQLGEETTAAVLAPMGVEAITLVSRYIAAHRSIEKTLGMAVLEEFFAIIRSNRYLGSGGIDYARETLYKALGEEEARKILDRLGGSMNQRETFGYLSRINSRQVAELIKGEHPQTIALIAAHMEPAAAAETLSRLPEELRAEVAIRMANLGEISPAVVKRVSEVLKDKIEFLGSFGGDVGGTRAVADVFARLGLRASRLTLAHIEQRDSELAASIKEMMFTFEDIVHIDHAGIREIVRAVEPKQLMLALKSAAEELKEKFLANMPLAEREAFVSRMKFLGAVRVKEVEEAQQSIVQTVRSLAEAGMVHLGAEAEMID